MATRLESPITLPEEVASALNAAGVSCENLRVETGDPRYVNAVGFCSAGHTVNAMPGMNAAFEDPDELRITMFRNETKRDEFASEDADDFLQLEDFLTGAPAWDGRMVIGPTWAVGPVFPEIAEEIQQAIGGEIK